MKSRERSSGELEGIVTGCCAALGAVLFGWGGYRVARTIREEDEDFARLCDRTLERARGMLRELSRRIGPSSQ